MTRIAILCLLGALSFTCSASAAGIERKEGNYIFGTQLMLKVSQQVVDPNTGYWGTKLPMEYTYSVGEIVKRVNAARKARGVADEVDVTRYPIGPGMETAVEGGFEYNIDFATMTPEDVEVVLAEFPLTGVFSDATLRVQPVNTGFYYGNSENGDTVTVAMPGDDLTLNLSMSYTEIEKAVSERVKATFGEPATFDFSWNMYKPQSGMRSANVNITVYLDASQVPVGGYPDYHGD